MAKKAMKPMKKASMPRMMSHGMEDGKRMSKRGGKKRMSSRGARY